MSLQIGGGYLNEVSNVEHAKAPVESGAKRFVIGVFRFFEGFECLRANCVGRYEPKHNGKFALKVSIRSDFAPWAESRVLPPPVGRRKQT